MGVWNGTDMFSQLPIFEGETAFAVLLAQRGTPGPSSLPNQIWTPVSPVLMGTYNGIGGLSSIYKEAEFSQFYQQLAASDSAKSRFSSDGGKTHLNTISDLVEYAAENAELQLEFMSISGMSNPIPVSMALIRPEVFAYAMAAIDEMAQEKGFSLEELGSGAFDMTHPTLRALKHLGADIMPVLRLNLFLREMRMQWQPQSGAGSQNGIEHAWQMNYYKTITTIAESMLHRATQS